MALSDGYSERPQTSTAAGKADVFIFLNLLKQSAIPESAQQRSGSLNVPDLADTAKKTQQQIILLARQQ